MRASIRSLLFADKPTLSFEFFPAKTDEGAAKLRRTVRDLSSLAPDFVSVTYGAGGSTQDRTSDIVRWISAETDLRPVMHLTCVGADRAALVELAHETMEAGVTDVLALRGDPPGGPDGTWTQTPGGLRYATDLIRLLHDVGPFSIGVAAFPEGHLESTDLESDVDWLAAKCGAGADYAITQFFFDAEQYRTLVERLRQRGCDTPVIPGVLPVTNPVQTRRFAAKAGATIPAALDARFAAVEDDADAVFDLGVEVATQLCLDLLDVGAPGLHFYTQNRSAATRAVHEALTAAGVWTDALLARADR